MLIYSSFRKLGEYNGWLKCLWQIGPTMRIPYMNKHRATCKLEIVTQLHEMKIFHRLSCVL